MMNYKKLEDGVFIDVSFGHLTYGDRIKKEVVKGVWQESNHLAPAPTAPIRIISTGAMQRRFTIPEEVFITSDAAATVVKSRLMNSSYCDLDFQDTIDGITYICGVLFAGGIIPDSSVRVAELLVDGTEAEKA